MTRADLDERAAQLRAAGEPFVRARVVLAHRPTSAKPGDEAIVHADGSIEGFVGGTCAESAVRMQSLRLLTPSAPAAPLLLRIRPDAPADPGAEEGGTLTVHNPCLSGGALEIFLDPVVPPPLVLVHGDGPVATAIAAVTAAAGYRCGAADAVDGADAVVVASHGRDEAAVLCAALDAAVPYVGLVASRRRGAAVLAEIVADRPDLAGAATRIDTPAGLDLGGRSAGEVAVSILAAVIASRATTRTPTPAVPAHPVPAPPAPTPPALIIYARAAELTANVTGEQGEADFIRAPGRADQFTANVNGGTEVADFVRAGADDQRGQGAGRGGSAGGTATAVDPVCGMSVAAVPASLHLERDGRTVWFCAPGCRRAFQKDPARYPES